MGPATQFDKAIAAAVVAVVALLALIFHWSVPGWLTEENILQALVVIMPIVVSLVPNKATTAQKTEVLATVGVTPAMASMGVGTGGMPVSASDQASAAAVGGIPNPVNHLQ